MKDRGCDPKGARRGLEPHLDLSRQYLARVMAAVFGTSIREFLRARRFQRAEHLLLHTSYSTVAIATLSAFGTTHAFYRAFKAVYGTTPDHYRKQATK